jgi:cytosine/uracil/thiamine/allantoin permease
VHHYDAISTSLTPISGVIFVDFYLLDVSEHQNKTQSDYLSIIRNDFHHKHERLLLFSDR